MKKGAKMEDNKFNLFDKKEEEKKEKKSFVATPKLRKGKVANIILAECFNKPAIAVDVHVHRISNRTGLIKTTSPLQTEFALMKLYPKEEWKNLNKNLVVHGQNICLPIKPKCSVCPVKKYCKYYTK